MYVDTSDMFACNDRQGLGSLARPNWVRLDHFCPQQKSFQKLLRSHPENNSVLFLAHASGGLEQRKFHPPTQCLVASMSPELQEVLQLPHVFVLTCKFLQRRRQRRLSTTCQDNRRLFRRWRRATRLAGVSGIVDPAYYSDEASGQRVDSVLIVLFEN